MTKTVSLLEEEGRYLLKVARRTLEGRLMGLEATEEDDSLPPIFLERHGTFVTLTKKGNLRGCIGHILPHESLIEGIRTNAVNAALNDPRFPPLRREELHEVRIEISVLSTPERLEYAHASDLLARIRPHVDGVIIKKGYHQATFLPQVWEQLPDKAEFLGQLCLKAGLGERSWESEDLEVSVYQVQAFEEGEGHGH